MITYIMVFTLKYFKSVLLQGDRFIMGNSLNLSPQQYKCLKNLKKNNFQGGLWSSVERFSVQGVQFLVMLIIARVLDTKDFESLCFFSCFAV